MAEIETFRDPALSLWQSAIHTVVKRQSAALSEQLSANHPLMQQANSVGKALHRGPPSPLATLSDAIVDPIATLATRIAIATFERDEALLTELSDLFRYSEHDPLWAEALVVYSAWIAERKPIPYRTYQSLSDFVLPLPTKMPLVVAVVSDWGTGTPEAKQLLIDVASHHPDVLVHLGDIYYSGTPDEAEDNFYDLVIGQFPTTPTFTLSGNHDMYSGGIGYYPLLDRIGQPASYFCLRNDRWQFLALDTGLHDSDVFNVKSNLTYLEPSEVVWHQDKLVNAGGRKTILLSHHQLFSTFDGGVGLNPNGDALAVNPNLYQAFADQPSGVSLDNMVLWLWGHEHNLIVFNPYLGLARGRCIGAGAIPVAATQNPYSINSNLLLPVGQSAIPTMLPNARLGTSNGYYNHCYALITLSDTTSQVDYYQVSIDRGVGSLLFSETIA